MLKASAPQKRIRRGSCCFVAVLDQRTLVTRVLQESRIGLVLVKKRGDI